MAYVTPLYPWIMLLISFILQAINGEVIDIQSEAENAKEGSYVKGGCGAACKDHACKLGSTCTDDYNVYRCNCTMTPFYGYFCHKGLFVYAFLFVCLHNTTMLLFFVVYVVV